MSLTGKASKSPQWTFSSPIICSSPGKAQERSYKSSAAVGIHLSVSHSLALEVFVCENLGNRTYGMCMSVCMSIPSQVRGLNDRMMISWLRLCFHSPVIRWFVIAGLGRLVFRKRPLLSRTESLFTKKSMPSIRCGHLWFTPICIYPKHCIKSMKLITLSCCLFLTQLNTHTHMNTH